jgi:23S rRNA (guanosine2251-2'-O)-methyltransferase
MKTGSHPRDRFITIFGRKPVLEALRDEALTIEKLLVANNAKGDLIKEIIGAASQRKIKVLRRPPKEITRISRNGRQDQGVVVDVQAPSMSSLEDWLGSGRQSGQLFILDGVTTPGNVGMIIRSVTAAGATGIVVPRRGCPEIGPLVIKASAGVALRSTILRCETTVGAINFLRQAGWTIAGLRGHDAESLYETTMPERVAWVLGNESVGISEDASARIEHWVEIPMAMSVESLNVATAAAVVAFEHARSQRSNTAPMGA